MVDPPIDLQFVVSPDIGLRFPLHTVKAIFISVLKCPKYIIQYCSIDCPSFHMCNAEYLKTRKYAQP